jgi:uncharacterized protein YeaO (DUF488 family)
MGNVWTSSIRYDREDRFDITRKTGGARGKPFAPPESSFLDMISLRKILEQRKLVSVSATNKVKDAWDNYRESYLAAMRASYKNHRESWDALVKQEEVTLVCYCEVPTRCHRLILASEILPKIGMTFCGER